MMVTTKVEMNNTGHVDIFKPIEKDGKPTLMFAGKNQELSITLTEELLELLVKRIVKKYPKFIEVTE